MNACAHRRTSRGSVYEYCEGCGATRHAERNQLGEMEPWHSCAKCYMRPPLEDQVMERELQPLEHDALAVLAGIDSILADDSRKPLLRGSERQILASAVDVITANFFPSKEPR